MKEHLIAITFLLLIGSCSTLTDAETQQLEQAVAVVELENSKLLVSVVANELDVPWEITMSSNGWLWFTEQKGTINRIHLETGQRQMLKQIEDIHYKKSRGLLGMALHPKFEEHPYIYAHYTYSLPSESLNEIIESRLVRFTFREDTLVERLLLLDKIPGKSFHNGSRIAITPDHKLFLTTGDVGNTKGAQNPSILSGKTIRMNLDGSIPEDNPIPNSYVWSWGHRNSQGLVWANGKLYASEHGAITEDEINIIQKGGNYGWNQVEGFCNLPKELQYCQDSTITEPLKSWTPTLGIAGLDYYQNNAIPEWNNSLISANMKGRALRILSLNEKGEKIIDEKIYFQKKFGRIRDVAVAPNGDIYFSTSNMDWHVRYQPWMYDSLPEGGDRILRLSSLNEPLLAAIKAKPRLPLLKQNTVAMSLLDENWNYEAGNSELSLGEQLYQIHCATCHRPDGKGTEGLIPTLADTDWVTGDRPRLINLLLNGLSDPIEVNGIIYEQEMPAYNMLEDDQIAAIINYIRSSFGNEARGVTVAEVQEERKL